MSSQVLLLRVIILSKHNFNFNFFDRDREKLILAGKSGLISWFLDTLPIEDQQKLSIVPIGVVETEILREELTFARQNCVKVISQRKMVVLSEVDIDQAVIFVRPSHHEGHLLPEYALSDAFSEP